MKQLLVSAVLALGLVGCNEMKGTLSAHESLSLNDKDGKVSTIAPGTYSAELEAKDKNTVKVKIEGAAAKGKDLKFTFTMPANSMKAGHFDIPASQTGQPYGVRGDHETTTTESDIRSGYESCTYDVWETRCGSDRYGRVICQRVPVTRWGQRYISYTDVTQIENLALDLVGANDTVAGQFDGNRTETFRNYRDQGLCR